MVLIDLMLLSQHQTVVADVLFTPDILTDIVKVDHAVFLTTAPELVRQDYFARANKKDFYDCVMSLSDPTRTFENIFQTVEAVNRIGRERIQNGGYPKLERTANSVIEDTLAIIEGHFGLVR